MSSRRAKFHVLYFQVLSLQANADVTTEQTNTMKAKLEKFKDVNEDENENNMKMVESEQEKVDIESGNEGRIIYQWCNINT